MSNDQKYAHTDGNGKVLGFYMDSWHAGSIPEGAIPISDQQHAALMDGQAQGMDMHVNPDGSHYLKEPPPPTPEQKASYLRKTRNEALTATDFLVRRHTDQRDLGEETTLTDEQYKEALKYRAKLRNLPESDGFPDVTLPDAPDFIKE